jgi:uncharacterized protein YcfJ
MKSNEHSVHSAQEATENLAKGCQISRRTPACGARIESQSRNANWWIKALWVVAILAISLGIAAPLEAQTERSAWLDLNGLRAGQGIEVIDITMKRYAGEFVSVTEEVLTLKEKGINVPLKRDEVVRVSTSSGPKRGAHAAIGLVAGAAIGAGIGAAAGSNHGFLGGSSRGIAALVGLAIGGVSGSAVGALLPAHTTIYRTSVAATRAKERTEDLVNIPSAQ